MLIFFVNTHSQLNPTKFIKLAKTLYQYQRLSINHAPLKGHVYFNRPWIRKDSDIRARRSSWSQDSACKPISMLNLNICMRYLQIRSRLLTNMYLGES